VRSAAVVHVLGQSNWFDAARWEAFNIRRERLASKARSKLVFWLDAEAIRLASRSAPDLWSWRGGVYSFVSEAVPAGAHTSATSSGDITLDARIDRNKAFRSSLYGTDTRSMAERSRRVVEIKAWLARHPEAPDELQVSPIDELGRLLFSLGDYDDALEHRQHIELPMFHRLNDSRSAAITQGQIADILQRCGNNEEALHILNEEVLPAAERIQDIALIVNSLYQCKTIRLNCGGLNNQADAQRIAEELKRSFELLCQLERVDGIACVGSLFGHLLVRSGFVNEALPVLEKAGAAFELLQEPDQAAKLRELVNKLQDKVQ
jgi:hypothetical protein